MMALQVVLYLEGEIPDFQFSLLQKTLVRQYQIDVTPRGIQGSGFGAQPLQLGA